MESKDFHRWRTVERTKQERDILLLTQPSNWFHKFWRAVNHTKFSYRSATQVPSSSIPNLPLQPFRLLSHRSVMTTLAGYCPEPVEGVDVCPPSWAENPEYQGQTSYFGGAPPLSLTIGYLVVLGFGALFSVFTTIVVYLDKVFAGNASITSEHFKWVHNSMWCSVYYSVVVLHMKHIILTSYVSCFANRHTTHSTAGRMVKTGLTASVIVSQWTWAATLLQSSNVAWQYGVSGPFWWVHRYSSLTKRDVSRHMILYSFIAIIWHTSHYPFTHNLLLYIYLPPIISSGMHQGPPSKFYSLVY